MSGYLAGDIGGTNARFGRFTMSSAGLALDEALVLGTSAHASFTDLMRAFLATQDPGRLAGVEAVVLAVAGPVERDGLYSNPPLIPWEIDVSAGAWEFPLPAPVLINDFVAQAYAVTTKAGASAREVLAGEPDPGGTIAVLGAGTGLGKAMLVARGGGAPRAVPSEGGHAAFPCASIEEYAFHEFGKRERGEDYLTWNTVVSGGGLSLLHRFLTGEDLTPAEVASRFATGASDTLAWAARFYGRCARDFALDVLATGGVYIAGGVAAKNPEVVTHPAFGREFRASGAHRALLERIPVRLIADDGSGLWGAARYASMIAGREAARG
jgi:glucokinase